MQTENHFIEYDDVWVFALLHSLNSVILQFYIQVMPIVKQYRDYLQSTL